MVIYDKEEWSTIFIIFKFWNLLYLSSRKFQTSGLGIFMSLLLIDSSIYFEYNFDISVVMSRLLSQIKISVIKPQIYCWLWKNYVDTCLFVFFYQQKYFINLNSQNMKSANQVFQSSKYQRSFCWHVYWARRKRIPRAGEITMIVRIITTWFLSAKTIQKNII